MKSTPLPWVFRLVIAATCAIYPILAGADPASAATVGESGVARSNPSLPVNSLNQGYAYLEAGKYHQAMLAFDRALGEAQAREDVAEEAETYSAVGYTLYLMRQPDEATKPLTQALEMAVKAHDTGLEGRVRAYLGLLYAESGDTRIQAEEEFQRSLSLARGNKDAAMEYDASLQLARLEPAPAKRLEKLQALSAAVLAAGMEDRSQVTLLLNIADQLKHLQALGPDPTLAPEIRTLGHAVAEKAAPLAAEAGLVGALSQIEGYRAGLYEQDGKTEEATALLIAAIQHADSANAPDLAMQWQADLGRLLARQGRVDRAIEAYRRAVFHIGEILNDIPVTYQDGKSSYSETLEPIYRGLADLLLRKAARANQPEEAQYLLLETISTLERLKQSEMEDYFNDRCALESAPPSEGAASAAASKFAPRATSPGEAAKLGNLAAILNRAKGNTAILYPIIFADRLEVLLIHDGVIHEKTVHATREQVTKQVLMLNMMLRNADDYRQILKGSRQLYQWIVEPVEANLRGFGVDRLVYIPDGKLRLDPLAVLYDGKHFVVENYSVITNSSLQFNKPRTSDEISVGKALLAGLSVPDGPSLEQIPEKLLFPDSIPGNSSRGLEDGKSNVTRQTRAAEMMAMKAAPDFREKATQKLALPGVGEEIQTLEKELSNKTLLNQTFTSKNLEEDIQSGDYQVIHISSHGYFGHTSEDSFILTYDKALGVSEVERIMKLKPGQGHSIELVTFSACQTAQGDERAPLGFSGLAIKANARHAMGSLWPIDDEATKQFMKDYYAALANARDPAKALQLAQKAMLAVQTLAHPTYWAAFVVVGEW